MLSRLQDQEYLSVHRSRAGAGFSYELCWDGQGRDGSHFLQGLADPDRLTETHGYDDGRSGLNGLRSGSGRPPVGAWSGGVDLSAENASREDLAETVVGVEATG